MNKKIKLRDMTKDQFNEWVKRKCKKTDCYKCPFYLCVCDCNEACWVNHKDMCSDKFLDQEVDLSDLGILSQFEKDYLKSIISPFRDEVKTIKKYGSYGLCFLVISLGCIRDSKGHSLDNNFTTNYEVDGLLYIGMEYLRAYTLEELGL